MLISTPKPLTVPKAAERLGVAPAIIRTAILRGQLPALDMSSGTGKRKHWRIMPADLEAFAAAWPRNGSAE